MAISKLLVSLILVYYNIVVATSTTTSLIQNVCSKAINPTLCTRLLSSDPRSARADIKGLAQISIDKTYASGHRVLTVVASLYKKANTSETKGQLLSCASYYKSALFNLDKAKDALKTGDREIYSDVISVIDGAESCDDEYDGPPVMPPKLEHAGNNFKDIAYVLFTVIKSL